MRHSNSLCGPLEEVTCTFHDLHPSSHSGLVLHGHGQVALTIGCCESNFDQLSASSVLSPRKVTRKDPSTKQLQFSHKFFWGHHSLLNCSGPKKHLHATTKSLVRVMLCCHVALLHWITLSANHEMKWINRMQE